MRNRKKLLIIAGIVIVIAGAAAVALGLFSKDAEQTTPEKPEVFYSKLTGEEVPQDVADRPILGVMIENSEEARPQTGLDAAGIVFETVTEGGITRYLALYQDDVPEIVGPVRSVRPAFVDWMMGFDASIAHVGGSAPALQTLEDRDARTLNQFFNSGPYYRVNDRAAPHNMYARTDDLRELERENGHETSEFAEIPRSDDSPAQEPNATTIDIDFSSPLFKTQYRYDKESNAYTRYLAGARHIDAATKKPITVKNLVVLKMTGNIKAIGSGKALLYKDGTVQTIRWQQDSFRERLELLDEQGNPVRLNRGDTWIAAVPGSGSVSH